MAPGVEEELQQLRAKLQEEESASRTLQERLKASEQLLNEKEQGHAEQVCLALAVAQMWMPHHTHTGQVVDENNYSNG